MRESVRPQTAHPPSRPAAEVTPTSPTVQHRSTRAEQPRGPLIPTAGKCDRPRARCATRPRAPPVAGGEGDFPASSAGQTGRAISPVATHTTSRQLCPESSKREPRAGAAPTCPGRYLFSTPVNMGAPLVGRSPLTVAGLYIQPYRATSGSNRLGRAPAQPEKGPRPPQGGLPEIGFVAIATKPRTGEEPTVSPR